MKLLRYMEIFLVIFMTFFFAKYITMKFVNKVIYKNSLQTTNGQISLMVIEGSPGDEVFGDFPAMIDIIIKEMKPNKYGVCDIPTGRKTAGLIGVNNLNKLNFFANTYLDKVGYLTKGDPQ